MLALVAGALTVIVLVFILTTNVKYSTRHEASKGNFRDRKRHSANRENALIPTFSQDRRRGWNGDRNPSVVGNMALNMLKQDETVKVGINVRRKCAGWDEFHLAKVLSN
jgi:hypothetical protein